MMKWPCENCGRMDPDGECRVPIAGPHRCWEWHDWLIENWRSSTRAVRDGLERRTKQEESNAGD